MADPFTAALAEFQRLRRAELAMPATITPADEDALDAATDATGEAYRALLAIPAGSVAEGMLKVDAIIDLHDGLIPVEGLVNAIKELRDHLNGAGR